MTALRFCFLTTFYPPFHFGGDAIAVQRLARALVRRGHAVSVIHDRDAFEALRTGPAPADAPATDGVEVLGLRSSLGRLSSLLTQQIGRPVVHGTRIRRYVADGRFDVVNFHNVSLVGGPGLLACGGGATTLYTAHEHWLVCPTHVLWRHRREPCTGRECVRCQLRYHRPPQAWRVSGLLDRHLDQVDAFIAMSEFSRDKHREFGFRRAMEVLPPFVAARAPAPPPNDGTAPHERPYFLFAGRLERIKGLDDVIPLFAGPGDADLVVAGDGTHAADLRRLAAGAPRVRFLGHLAAEALPPLYRGAVAVIAPTVGFETFGMTLIEAMQERTPVLARAVGPYPEIVRQSGGGELFSTGADLAAAMRRLLEDPARRDRLAAAGAAAVEARWSEPVVVPRYLEIVERARARRRAAVPPREVA